MKVQFTPSLLTFKTQNQQFKNNKNNDIHKNYSYNPIAYNDYNISFGARLFRSPENFYEQDFNKNGMPVTLHRYIYNPSQLDFRKTIPPAQAMKEVFGSIAYMQNLEQVKEAFPDEPLFKDLHSKSSKNARTGILGELALLREDKDFAEKSLFKNGKDDLGMYILKKIYVEGKTLKEINKDFHKDKSVAYKGLSDIQYTDLRAFGIHFPKSDFWKSFIATREDFPYVFIPRKIENQSDNNRLQSVNNRSAVPVKPRAAGNRFADVKDWEIDKMSEALIDGMGDKAKTEKQFKKHNLRNSETLNFVAQYMGEINSVVLEKLHVSEDMKDFFNNYDNLSKSQKEKFTEYWHIPDTDKIRSKVMSSTIRLFFDAYGVDGNNEEFQELLEYARNIKPNRILSQQKHDRIQAEYDEMFANLQETAENIDVKVDKKEEPIQDEHLSFNEVLQKEVQSQKGKTYNFKLDDDTHISIVANLQEMLKNKIYSEYANLPVSYVNKLYNFMLNHPLVTEEYLLSLFYNIENMLNEYDFVTFDTNMSQQEKDEFNKQSVAGIRAQLMPVKKAEEITQAVQKDFFHKNKKYIIVLNQVLMELTSQLQLPDENTLKSVLWDEYNKMKADGVLPEEISGKEEKEAFEHVYKRLEKNIKDLKQKEIAFLSIDELKNGLYLLGVNKLSPQQQNFIESRIKSYSTPLSQRERNKITLKLADSLINYQNEVSPLYNASMAAVRRHPDLKKFLMDILGKICVSPENTTLRYFIDKDADENIINSKIFRLIAELFAENEEMFKLMGSMDLDIMDKYIKPYDPELYYKLLNYRNVTATQFKLRNM